MPIEVLMPALSPTMSEGNLAKWMKKEGDEVRAGDVIAEIETDKATMEVEAVDEGTLGKILVSEGTEGVAVNTPIALLLEEGEDKAALEGAASGAGKAKDGGGGAEARGDGADGGGKPNGSGPPRAAETPPRPGPSGTPSSYGEGETSGATGAAPPSPEGGERIFASPLAKRMAQQAGLDLASIEGSGPHGRIIKVDVEKAMSEPKAAKAEADSGAPQKPAAPDGAKGGDAGPTAQAQQHALTQPTAPYTSNYTEVALSSMRKVVARRLTESKQTIPHFYLSIDIELDALLGLRSQLNAREGADYKLSVNDFVIKATALGLRRVPGCNAAWGGDKILQYNEIDISVAVAIEGGLITPIVRRADQKGLSTISNEMKDLAKRAKEGKLKPEEFQGGGFSISNLGMFGITTFQAVINPPQACILAVGTGVQKPVVKGGAVAIATTMSCTLSVDHRAVDGALGAQFLAELKKIIEDPLSLLL